MLVKNWHKVQIHFFTDTHLSKDLEFVATLITKVHIDVKEIKTLLSVNEGIAFEFPINSIDGLTELNNKVNDDAQFAANVVSLKIEDFFICMIHLVCISRYFSAI